LNPTELDRLARRVGIPASGLAVAEPVAHRVAWFAPPRPVDGATVFVWPVTPPTPPQAVTDAPGAQHDAQGAT